MGWPFTRLPFFHLPVMPNRRIARMTVTWYQVSPAAVQDAIEAMLTVTYHHAARPANLLILLKYISIPDFGVALGVAKEAKMAWINAGRWSVVAARLFPARCHPPQCEPTGHRSIGPCAQDYPRTPKFFPLPPVGGNVPMAVV